MTAVDRPRVLCVDDEVMVLDGLRAILRRTCEVLTASSGAEGLAIIEATPDLAAVISDMRMPGMDGAAFLHRVAVTTPDTVRVLLTGQTDIESAIAAVNQGQIFRFLTKPCAPDVLVATVKAAVEQHRLITSERVLLEQTLHGSIKALVEVLSLTSPMAFGRASRVKEQVSTLAARVGLKERWPTEVAALLSQLGAVTLPPDTVERLYDGRPLRAQDVEMVKRLPAVTEQLLAHIPRLEPVRAILSSYSRNFAADDPSSASIPVGRESCDWRWTWTCWRRAGCRGRRRWELCARGPRPTTQRCWRRWRQVVGLPPQIDQGAPVNGIAFGHEAGWRCSHRRRGTPHRPRARGYRGPPRTDAKLFSERGPARADPRCLLIWRRSSF